MSSDESSFYRRRGKRLLDLTLAVPAALAAAPLVAVVALAVRWSLGPPVLFRQQRPGLGALPFTLVKFRTMAPARSGEDYRSDRRRLTRLGRLLRRWSLDELPELWNVLKGEMSLVGPRPLLTKYLERYTAEEMRRHEVKPGLTGWAQVNGRNRTSWEERFAHDLWYVDRCSLALDLRIIGRTFVALLRSDGGVEQGTRLGEFPGRSADRAEGRGR